MLMRLSRPLLCLTGLLLSPLTGKGQHIQPPYSMQLSAHNSTSGADFRVILTRKADFVYLRYGRLDSVQNGRLRSDPHYTVYTSALQATQLPVTERTTTAQRFMTLLEQYKVYRWDSLRVATSSHPSFLQLLDSIYSSSAAHLERPEANRRRIVLDGTLVHLVVTTGSLKEKDLYVRSPRPDSHPQLYRLLHESLQLYRQKHPASFLDPSFTSGY